MLLFTFKDAKNYHSNYTVMAKTEKKAKEAILKQFPGTELWKTGQNTEGEVLSDFNQ